MEYSIKMRFFLLLAFITPAFSHILAQDVIVLRKDESEIKCKIVNASDSLVTYKLWNSADTSTYSLKRYDVLSFATSKQSQRKDKVVVDMAGTDDGSILGIYRSGETMPGWVVPTFGDTLFGFIRITDPIMNQVQVQFINESGFDTVYGTKAVRSYGYGNVVYDRIKTCYRKELKNEVKTDDGIQFIHRAIDGPSKLYRFYTLTFSKSAYKSYNNNPPMYLGVMKRKFLVTNPAGKMLFSKGRTLPGMMNRIYYDYSAYSTPYHLRNPSMTMLPEAVSDFNHWYVHNGQKK